MYNKQIVNVIMPAYNEEATIYDVVVRVLKQKSVDRLIIVNDGSKDKTSEQIRRAIAKDDRALLIECKTNNGKGSAVILGIKEVKSGIIIIQDADKEYYPEDYPMLLEKLDGKTPVFGYRMRNERHKYVMGVIAAKVHTILFNLLYNQSIHDVNAGYKLFTVDMISANSLSQKGFEIDFEIATQLAKKGYKIREVPIRYSGRTFAEGKKIGPKDAINMAIYLISRRIS